MEQSRLLVDKKFQSPKRKLKVAQQSAKKSNHGISAPIHQKSMEDFQNYVDATAALGITPVLTISSHPTHQGIPSTPACDTSTESSPAITVPMKPPPQVQYTPMLNSTLKTSARAFGSSLHRSGATDKASPLTGASFSSLADSVNRSSSSESSLSAASSTASNLKSFQSPNRSAEKTSSYADRLQFFASSERRFPSESSYDDILNASPIESAENSFCDDATSSSNCLGAGVTAGDTMTPAAPCLVDGSGVTSRLSDLHVSYKSRQDGAYKKSLGLGSSSINSSIADEAVDNIPNLALAGTPLVNKVRPQTTPRSTPQAFRAQVSADSAKYQNGESPFRDTQVSSGHQIQSSTMASPIPFSLPRIKPSPAISSLVASSRSASSDDNLNMSHEMQTTSISRESSSPINLDDSPINPNFADSFNDTGSMEGDQSALSEDHTQWKGPARLFATLDCAESARQSDSSLSCRNDENDELCCSEDGADETDQWIHSLGERGSTAAARRNNQRRLEDAARNYVPANSLFRSPEASSRHSSRRILFGSGRHSLDGASSPPDFGTPVPHIERVDSPVDFDHDYVLDIEEDDLRGATIQDATSRIFDQEVDAGRSVLQYSPVRRPQRNSPTHRKLVTKQLDDDFVQSGRSDHIFDSFGDGIYSDSEEDMVPGFHTTGTSKNIFKSSDDLTEQRSGANCNAPAILELSACSSLSDVSMTRSIGHGSDSPLDVLRGSRVTATAMLSNNNISNCSSGSSASESFSVHRRRKSSEGESTHSSSGGLNSSTEPIGINFTLSFADSVGSSRSGDSAVGGEFKRPTLSRDSSLTTAVSQNLSHSTVTLPMPDQSAFEFAGNVSRCSDVSSPMCPPTPARTPIWMRDDAVASSSSSSSLFRHQINHNNDEGPPLQIMRQNSLVESKLLLSQDDDDLEMNDDIAFGRDFTVEQLLGTGSFGEVFQVRDKHRGNQLFAVKKSTRQFRSRKDREWLLREVKIMKCLGKFPCPYMIHLVKAWQEHGYFFVQLDFADRGSIADMMTSLHRSGQHLSDHSLSYIIHNVASGLAHIHGLGWLHMDIKPANLLLSSPGLVKIADFGMAIPIGNGDDGQEGDTRYMAPELLTSLERQPSIDIYSLGITLYEMCMQRVTHHDAFGASSIKGDLLGPPQPHYQHHVSILGSQDHLHGKAHSLWTLPGDGPMWHILRNDEFEPIVTPSDDLRQIVTWAMKSTPTLRPSAAQILLCPSIQMYAEEIDPFVRDFIPVSAVPPVPLGRSHSFEESMQRPPPAGMKVSGAPPLPSHARNLHIIHPTALGIDVATAAGESGDRVMTPISGFSYNFWLPQGGAMSPTTLQHRKDPCRQASEASVTSTIPENTADLGAVSTPIVHELVPRTETPADFNAAAGPNTFYVTPK